MIDLPTIRRAVRRLADPKKAAILQSFFKTGRGGYAEGDRFLGLTVPKVRVLVRKFEQAGLRVIGSLVASPIHEERLLGLLLLVGRYPRAVPAERQRLYRLYLRSFPHINNWDLVDGSAEHIVGPHLADRSKAPLVSWARSENLWERRIAILSTFHYIKRREFAETLKIARLLLRDPHDLIHKAVGWMLREIGKRDLATEERFLKAHYRRMPRTMLRYAIERFPKRKRLAYLKGTM